MTKKQFQGTGTALVTPFSSDGSVDEKALRRLVDFQISEGMDMLLPCGTTGEGATLDADETDRVVQIVIEQSQRRRPGRGWPGGQSTPKRRHGAKRPQRGGGEGV